MIATVQREPRACPAPVLLFVDDGPVLSSLQFALAIEGYDVLDGAAEGAAPQAVALVIDQAYVGDGLRALSDLRAAGCFAPAFLLATNPGERLRSRAATAGADVIEKPLLGDELGGAIRTALSARKAG